MQVNKFRHDLRYQRPSLLTFCRTTDITAPAACFDGHQPATNAVAPQPFTSDVPFTGHQNTAKL